MWLPGRRKGNNILFHRKHDIALFPSLNMFCSPPHLLTQHTTSVALFCREEWSKGENRKEIKLKKLKKSARFLKLQAKRILMISE